MADSRLRAWLGVYLKGVFMGAADSVPGVSGGTIAFITGIYERLIRAVTALDPRVLSHLPAIHTPAGRGRLRDELAAMDVGFLVVLGLGVVSAIVLVSRAVQAALAAVPGQTFAFFFGLIAASAVVLYRQVAVDTPGRVAVALVGFAVAFVLSGITESSGLPHSPGFVFLAGMVAVSAMVLPGISGAFFLLLLGQYDYLTATLTAFTDGLIGLADGGRIATLIEPGATVVAFGVGAVVGLLSVAHAVKWALATHRGATLVFLVSLMVGALRLPAAEALANTPAWTPAATATTLLSAVVGAAIVFVLDRYTDDLEYAT